MILLHIIFTCSVRDGFMIFHSNIRLSGKLRGSQPKVEYPDVVTRISRVVNYLTSQPRIEEQRRANH